MGATPQTLRMSKQTWDPNSYRNSAAFVFESSDDLLERLAAQPGERVLDLGCGTGEHAAKLVARGVDVLAVDKSASMLSAARAAFPALATAQVDGEELGFDGEFDAVFSNAALHWMTRPERVANGVFRALRPGGRFVFEMPEAKNVDRTLTALDVALREHGAGGFERRRWYFPTVAQQATVLEQAGLEVRWVHVFERPSFVRDAHGESGLRVWVRLFAADVFDTLGSATDAVFTRAESLLTDLRRDGGQELDYVRLRMLAVRPR